METITEIKKIELELLPNGVYTVKINGVGGSGIDYKVPADNYRQWARVFSRLAMEMWASMDATMLKDKKED